MAIFMPGQVVSVEQWRYHEWDAVGWLQEIGSPRAADTPQLGVWCNTYGQANGMDPRILLTMLEKEQSFITRGQLSAHRRDWAMGFGVYPDGTHLNTWRGEPNVGPEQQIRHAAIRLRELATYADPHLTPNMGFPLENGPTRALYTYNPSVAGNYNFWVIFHRWFGDGGGTAEPAPATQPTADPKPPRAIKSDVAHVAHAAVEAHRAGRRTVTLHGVTFDLAALGWCGRFVRQCYAAAMRQHDPGFDEFGFGWLAPDAWQAEITLRAQGYEIPSSQAKPGDIVGLNRGLTAASHGHIGIWLGETIAENTSREGLGTVETPVATLAHRISGHFGVLPSGKLDVPGVAVVYPSDAEHAQRVDCNPYIGTDGRMYAQVAPLVTALGKVGQYREVTMGERRVKRYYVQDA